MDLRLTCDQCGGVIRKDSPDEEINTTAECQCGATFIVTVTRLR